MFQCYCLGRQSNQHFQSDRARKTCKLGQRLKTVSLFGFRVQGSGFRVLANPQAMSNLNQHTRISIVSATFLK